MAHFRGEGLTFAGEGLHYVFSDEADEFQGEGAEPSNAKFLTTVMGREHCSEGLYVTETSIEISWGVS